MEWDVTIKFDENSKLDCKLDIDKLNNNDQFIEVKFGKNDQPHWVNKSQVKYIRLLGDTPEDFRHHIH